jgi:hypothetical protein
MKLFPAAFDAFDELFTVYLSFNHDEDNRRKDDKTEIHCIC